MDLLRVLVVDDDAVLRIALKSLVAWQEHGYQMVGEAQDGAQALALCQALQPDIVITDMKMPGMDGIALIHRLQAMPQPPYIVALSGYDDFALVREAMRLGAADYLLKLELEPAQLLQSLAGARSRGHGGAAQNLPGKEERTRVLRGLVSRFYLDEQEMKTQLQAVGVAFPTEPVWCLLIKAGEMYRFEETTEEEYQTLQFSIFSIVEEIAGDCLHAYAVEGKTGEFYLFAALKPALQGQTGLVHQTAERMHEMLLRYLDLFCVIGIGQGDASPAGLTAACRQAAGAVRARFYAVNQAVIEWDGDRMPDGGGSSYSIAPQRARLTAGIVAIQEDAVRMALGQVKHDLATLHLPRNALLASLLDLYSGVREGLQQSGRAVGQVLRASGRSLPELLSISGMGEVQDWLDALEDDLCAFIRLENAEGYQKAVQKAKRLIEERYDGELTLQELAEELQLTPGYLSALMKKYAGMNFSEYLVHVRIGHAKKLLLGTTDKVYAVASQVGYADQFYFSRVFKRVVGLTPGEFRKRGDVR
ncbi:response regulator [Intestinibacillus massiliensis]|uniref:response regulator n=1 Tax=Intestinibacillus massiliensis TaxID=1871029 RepID=UPI00117A476B|nr:response regulator [Intestinibacillus massiliensis]